MITYFDSLMLIVIAYSCFMSMYFAAFEFPIENNTIFALENICTFFFVVEIITQFMRVEEKNNSLDVKVTHSLIAKRYFMKGAWIYEWAATIPLYLFQRYSKSEDTNEMVYVALKLVRLVRIPRIINLLDLSKINSVVETIFSG